MTQLSPLKPMVESHGAAVLPRKPVLLVVDDEEACREAVRLIFEDQYHVLLAPSGPQGLQLAAQHPVEVAITDLRMPGMSGLDFVERLKAFDSAIEVIVLTGFQSVEAARQALHLGAYEFLTKPFELPVLRMAIAGAFSRCAKIKMLRELETQNYQHNLQQELLRTKNQIYASILHDLNGPLCAVCGLADILQQLFAKATRLDGANLEEVKEYLAQVHSQTTLCVEIARRYRQFTLSTGREEKWASANQVLAELEQILRFHPYAKGQQWFVHKLAGDMEARINAVDLMQILLNLAINALQCTPVPHRLEVVAARQAQPLHLDQLPDTPTEMFLNRGQFLNAAPLLAITVEDNGPGIPPELMAKIFQPYFTTKSTRQNSGLGLAIVQRCIEANEAGLHLRSRPGLGTIFTVYLPAAGQPAG